MLYKKQQVSVVLGHRATCIAIQHPCLQLQYLATCTIVTVKHAAFMKLQQHASSADNGCSCDGCARRIICEQSYENLVVHVYVQ